MFVRTTSGQKVELELLPTSQVMERGLGTGGGGRVERRLGPLSTASRAFFARSPGGAAKSSPAYFEEKKSGLLRVVYKEIVIRFKRGLHKDDCLRILKQFGLAVRSENPFVTHQFVVVDSKDKARGVELLERANRCAEAEEVEFATPNFVSEYSRQALSGPHSAQWHLRDINAAEAWKITRGRGAIAVAVLDDGVDVEHPNLRGAIKRNPAPEEPRDLLGRDFFIPDDKDPEHYDPRPKKWGFPYGEMERNDIHGTPCAGLIAGRGVRKGALGIAPNCKILPVKIFHADDLASDERVADAIRYAALHADVISCSWTGPTSPDLELALQDALEIGRKGKGTAVFCATGNEGKGVGYPASNRNAIAVGATTDKGKLASYSNTGPSVWITAPGGEGDIFTTDVSQAGRGFNPGSGEKGGVDGLNTNSFDGTSAATPLVAGVAALMLSVNSRLGAPEIREILAKTAKKIGKGYDTSGHSKKFGYGRVDAAKAVAEARARR